MKGIANLNFSAVVGYDWYPDKCILNKITVDKDNNYYSADDCILYSKDGKTALLYFGNKTEDCVIPSGITTVESSFLNYVFSDDKTYDTVTIGKDVKNFGKEWYALSEISVKGYKDTAAESFAKKNGLNFIALNEE